MGCTGVQKAGSLGGQAGRPRCPVLQAPRKSQWFKWTSSGSEGGARVPKEKGSLTKEAGQAPHVCRFQGRDWAKGDASRRGEEVFEATAPLEGGREGSACRRRPGPREGQAGAGRFARRKRGCLPRRQQGTGGGRGGGWPAAEAWGSGEWWAGGRVSNCKHPHRAARHARA